MADRRPSLRRRNGLLEKSSENETPRTMIKTLLNITSVSQSTLLATKKRPSLIKSPLVSPPQKRRPLLKSIGDNVTPRTLLKNCLTEASLETPLEIPSSMNQVSQEGDTDQKQDAIYQTNSGELEDSNGIQSGECDRVNEDLLEARDSAMKKWDKSKWKSLVTPHFPVTKRRVLHEGNQIDVNLDQSREKYPTKNKYPTKTRKRIPTNTPAVTKRKSSASTSLPSSLVKSIFEHFSRSRVNNDTLQIIQKGSDLFFKQLSSDLMAYCKHAGRTTIETRDVELLMKRHGFITSNQSLNSLIEKYLPMEYRQELIPVAQSGNRILLKKST